MRIDQKYRILLTRLIHMSIVLLRIFYKMRNRGINEDTESDELATVEPLGFEKCTFIWGQNESYMY